MLRNSNPPRAGVRTAADVREDFFARGETVTGWALRHGFERHAVYAVLSGRTVGRRGAAHRIAVALGIKAAPDLRPEPIEPASQVPTARQAMTDACRRGGR
ncbi:MAG: DNA-binding protein [Betaproteobacteria bacterium]|nr:DNA-binding protein [Betaproteobacteria bacterium]